MSSATSKPKQEAPFRSICGTLFPMTDIDQVQALVRAGQEMRARFAMQAVAFVAYVEYAPTTNRPHIQFYIRTTDSHRMSWWTKMLPGAHVEKRKGTEHQAAEYCRKNKEKADTILIADYGTEKPEPEFNGDVTLTTIDMLRRGCKTYQIFKRFPKFYFNQARKIKELEADIELWNSMSVDLSEIEGLTNETKTPQVLNPSPLIEDSKQTGFGSFLPEFNPVPQVLDRQRSPTPVFGSTSTQSTPSTLMEPPPLPLKKQKTVEVIEVSDDEIEDE